MQHSLLLLSFVFTSFTDAVLLLSVPAEAHAARGYTPGSWWAQVGDRVFYAPPTSFLGLSHNVSDYYYVAGSKSAITPAMKEHIVGSEGHWHIMHLPKGLSMLQVSARSSSGDRRSAISALTQLKSGTVLSAGFPQYKLDANYLNPLDQDGQDLEKTAVASITPDTAMNYLQKLVEFPTRSYSNADASSKVEEFLKNEFSALGLHTCYHTFDSSGNSLTNVVAHVPGTGGAGAVIVGAHYDSRPFEGSAPGAEDNGSGVASLLAIAKTFMTAKAVPKKSVFFVAFAGEEPGLIGSKHFANALKSESLPSDCTAASSFMQKAQNTQRRDARRAKLNTADVGAIIMDEIGWLSPKLQRPTVNLESSDPKGKEVMDHLRDCTNTHNGEKMDVVHNSHPFGSDHMSFLENDMGAALTINGDDEAYPHYHQSSDTIENVNADLMMMITKMNLCGLMRMSGAR